MRVLEPHRAHASLHRQRSPDPPGGDSLSPPLALFALAVGFSGEHHWLYSGFLKPQNLGKPNHVWETATTHKPARKCGNISNLGVSCNA